MRRRTVAAVALVVALMASWMVPAQAQKSPIPGVDLALTTDGPTAAQPRGATFPVVLTVTNVGSDDASDVSITSYLSEAFDLEATVTSDPSMTCALGEYSQLDCRQPSLAAGDSSSVTLTLTRVMARESWLDAWASSSSDDPNYENNYGGLYLEADRTNPADVAVDVSAPEQPEVGEEFSYTSVVTNRGPEVARDVKFTQSLSEQVDYVSVTSSDPSDECLLHEETYDAEGVDGGPYTYSEVRCSLGNMQFVDQTTITLTVVRNDPHELWSSAWASTTSYDDNYENDYADASTAGHPSVTSDLGMTLTRPEQTLLVGDDTTYTLQVTNSGPAPATDVLADTWLPQELSLRAITPTRAGDVCEQNEYQGITCTFGTLAVGETTEVTIDVTRVRAREFWLGGSVWSTNYDPNYDNNYVEGNVEADKSTPADLGVKMDGPSDPAVGSDYDYTVTVTNHGPSPATAVALTTSVPEGTEFVSASSPDDSDTCSLFEESYAEEDGAKVAEGSDVAQYTYREVRCDLGTLVPAESTTVTVTLNRTTEYELWASAWVATASYDEDYDNDYASTGSYGEPMPGCGAPVSDDGSGIVACDAEGGGAASGKDNYYAVSSAPGKRALRAGAGNDTITMKIPTSSKRHRKVFVNGGRGNDTINLLLAPGAGNVTVVLKGGKGRDSINVIAPRPGKRFKLRMWGGAGNDSCASSMGDRHRSRAC